MTRKTMFLIGGLSLLTLGFAQSNTRPGNDPSPEPVNDVPAQLRTVDHHAFQVGEKLTYVVHYGFVNAGEAVVELKETDKEVDGRKLVRAVGTGRTLGAFNLFYRVEDHYETFMDSEGVFPWLFIRRVDEGGYIINQDYIYKQKQQKVVTQDKETFDIPAHAQDMLSSFYFARTIDFSNAQKGQVYTIDCFMDEENWPLKMRYLGKETVKTRSGKFKCIKFQPVLQEGRVFKDEEDLNVWITDDANRIPVLVRAKVLVGSIKMELTDYENVANPMAKVN